MLNVSGLNNFYFLRDFHDMRCKCPVHYPPTIEPWARGWWCVYCHVQESPACPSVQLWQQVVLFVWKTLPFRIYLHADCPWWKWYNLFYPLAGRSSSAGVSCREKIENQMITIKIIGRQQNNNGFYNLNKYSFQTLTFTVRVLKLSTKCLR